MDTPKSFRGLKHRLQPEGHHVGTTRRLNTFLDYFAANFPATGKFAGTPCITGIVEWNGIAPDAYRSFSRNARGPTGWFRPPPLGTVTRTLAPAPGRLVITSSAPIRSARSAIPRRPK